MNDNKRDIEYVKSWEFDTAIRFPLAPETFDTAWNYMSDFFSIGKALNCRPGDRILDFAGGSGYIFEMLNRLGIRTITLDINEEILKAGRTRLSCDTRLFPQNSHFCCGDGQVLPFAHQSFDGVICMNALHHMPNYNLTISEIFRILKPGCRAVFSEPGSEHSKSPESKRVIKEFGVVEKDVILSEIFSITYDSGFEKMYLLPLIGFDLMPLDLNEMVAEKVGSNCDQTRNKGSNNSKGLIRGFFQNSDNQNRWADRFIKEHPLFVLEKPGSKAITSVNPGNLNALIRLVTISSQKIRKGEPVTLTVNIKNLGDTLWLAEPREYGGFIRLGAKLHDNSGRLISHYLERANLPYNLTPGSSLELVYKISLQNFKPGEYILSLDMVDEQICWFQDKGSQVLFVPIEIASEA